MTEPERQALRQAIDATTRDKLFMLDSRGRQVRKPEARVSDWSGRIVRGIKHGSWGYRNHHCRCEICVEGERARNRNSDRNRRRRRKEATA